MNAGFAVALRAADHIDRVNRQLALVVRWGLLANALLIAGNAIIDPALKYWTSTRRSGPMAHGEDRLEDVVGGGTQ